ncbi:hypothetical protein QTP70_019815 [Hemibagrus guttatus]|uniref:EF-hand domain-containing protein n=1 Tax=Hemibagrus guttatus TaxID=175788 RepID=A0AAE0RE78_9TELE|nr:hypothetical protein QTP70_019815 [Hemibagrus guttatus]KAK3572220.1 hypothetical protein QTP86_027126 [Hemibagrus guttatus]
MSKLQQGMDMIIDTFYKYAGTDKDKSTLSKAELKEMLTKELGQYFGQCKDQQKLDQTLKSLDCNADGKVDFQEFITMLTCITLLCNDKVPKKK